MEQELFSLDEVKSGLKSFFSGLIQNAKEEKQKEDKKVVEKLGKEEKQNVENQEVDKRKLIDEVAGMMKSAGCSDEIIRTAIKDMEKTAYDKSTADTADNKCTKKADNSKEDDYLKVNTILNSINISNSANEYLPEATRYELGNKYFD